MKIILASPIYPPEIGGPATYTKELQARLAPKHNLTVITYANPKTDPSDKVVVIDKKNILPLRLWKYFLEINRLAREADVIYVQNAMAAGLPAVIAAKLRRKPVILKFVGDEAWERATQHKKTTKLLHDFLHNPDAGTKISLMKSLQGWVLRKCDIVTTPSIYLGELITEVYGLDKNKVKTNYNAAEKQPTPAPFDYKPKVHQLVATARLVKWKGIDGIIKAVAILSKNYPDVSLVIHGDGPERKQLEKLAIDEGVADRVMFTGNVSRTETWHTRKESEVYVLNSTYEGLPHTALTSFSAEIAIVATDTSGTNEAVYHEKTGLLVPQDNPEALASAIARLFEDKTLKEKLIKGGSDILEEKFSWEAHVGNLESLMQSVVNKPTH